jgi:hypothetical protein
MVSSRAISLLLLLSLSCTTMLAGCDMVLLRPSGYVALQQGHLVVLSTLLMLLMGRQVPEMRVPYPLAER